MKPTTARNSDDNDDVDDDEMLAVPMLRFRTIAETEGQTVVEHVDSGKQVEI